MSYLPESFDDFLSEITASISTQSGEAALRRINTERVLRLVLEEIVLQHHDLQIRVLSDSRIAGQAGADVLMQIDDYEVRLALLDTPQDPQLTLEQLANFRTIFEDNPSTEILILTWTTDDLKSERLNLNRIEYLLDHPEKLGAFLTNVRPLQEVVNQVLASHMKVWDTVMVSSRAGASSSGDLQQLFDKHLKTALHNERDRSYKTEAKKHAAWKFPEERELMTLTDVMKDALQGIEAKNLAERLIALPKRGGR